jgi:hypothetical protein
LYGINGQPYIAKGLWVICDGGYHKWKFLQCPLHIPIGEAQTAWSKKLESLRKDVECTYGILKGRFRILKYGIRCTDPEKVNDIVFTCMTLHNMLLEWDRLDVWEGVEVDWTLFNVEEETDAIEENVDGPMQNRILLSEINSEFRSRSDENIRVCDISETSADVDESHYQFRNDLVITYDYLRKNGHTMWPTRESST